MEASDFVRKCFAKVSCRKFSDNLKRVTVQNPCRKNSVVQSLFNETAGINSRPATLVKKKNRHQGGLPVNIFQCFYRKVLHELYFFDKIERCILQSCFINFINTLVHHRLFTFSSKKKTFSFFILFIAKLQSNHCGLATLLKETTL